MKTQEKQAVLQDWVCELSFCEQTVLLGAIRGCDVIAHGYEVSTKIVKTIRRHTLINARKNGYMTPFPAIALKYTEIYEFVENLREYPFQFILCISEAAEILGIVTPTMKFVILSMLCIKILLKNVIWKWKQRKQCIQD